MINFLPLVPIALLIVMTLYYLAEYFGWTKK